MLSSILSKLTAPFKAIAQARSNARQEFQDSARGPLNYACKDMRAEDISHLNGNLRCGDFRAADFSGMDLRGFDFTGARLDGANLDDTITDHTTSFSHAHFSALGYFEMRDLGLTDDDFRIMPTMRNGQHIGTNFDHAHAIDLVLDGSDISNAKLTNANVAGISCKNTICHGTDFTGSYTCLMNGAGVIAPRLKADSPQMSGAVISEDTIFDPKPYTRKIEADEKGDIHARIGPAQISFINGGGPGMII